MAPINSGTLVEHAATQALGGDVAEESLDHVEPRRRGRCEMHVEAWMLGKPVLHDGMFVRGVVVGNQMQRLVLGVSRSIFFRNLSHSA